MGYEVLLFAPNLTGYARLVLVFFSWIVFDSHPTLSITVYSASVALDAVDGYLARRFNQTSAFGAWFDVVIDNISRGMIWSRIYDFGYLVTATEWITFVCTHSAGSNWKKSFSEAPWWVKQVMVNNFKTFLGTCAISGLHILPIVLYAYHFGVLDALDIPRFVQYLSISVLSAGRALCFAVEAWCILGHIQYLLSDRANGNKQSPSSRGH